VIFREVGRKSEFEEVVQIENNSETMRFELRKEDEYGLD
jgi:hypothetical protein